MGRHSYSHRHPRVFFGIIFVVLSVALQILCVNRFRITALQSWMVAVNVTAFILWCYDKWRAGKKGLRVPEIALHFMAVCGASPASLVAMSVLRHKTSKRRFGVLYTVLLLLQGALLLQFGN